MTLPVKAVIFVVVSAGIAWGTRGSLRSLRYHGLYRFLGFEAIILLVLLNIEHWFEAPFSSLQLVSWFLLIVSLALVISAVWLLYRQGKPGKGRGDPSLIGPEKTTVLVTKGIYRYLRHPMYASAVYGVWGVFFKLPSWEGGAAALLATVFWTMTARIEEAENRRFFGAAYEGYMQQSKMFVPFVL
jgi:protein-S-isoprenylcysteine O-methyltransferase Ste14